MAGVGNKLYMHMAMKIAAQVLAGLVCLYHISMGHPDTSHSMQTHASAALLELSRSLYILKHQEQNTVLFMKITASKLQAWDHTEAHTHTSNSS